MPNKVLSSTAIKSITSANGLNILLKYATRTDTWQRTQLAQNVRDGFVKAMEKATVPDNAATAIMTETEHPSQKDSYPHYTTVYQDENGNHVITKHVDP